jgi:HlyD family secretion protein
LAANSSALFLIAADPKHMEVDASPSQGDIGAIRQGDAATMTIESIPDRVFSGTVSQVRRSPQSLQSAAIYDAVVTVDNPSGAQAWHDRLGAHRRRTAERRTARA